MTTDAATVIGGVDTHKHTHYAAVIDDTGWLVGHRQFPATDRGYLCLLSWLRGHGRIQAIGVESTGSFGAALTRSLTKAGERAVPGHQGGAGAGAGRGDDRTPGL